MKEVISRGRMATQYPNGDPWDTIYPRLQILLLRPTLKENIRKQKLISQGVTGVK